MPATLVILDACCLINLSAGGILRPVLEMHTSAWAAAEYVLRYEAVCVLDPNGVKGELRKESVDLQPLVATGLLRSLVVAGEGEAAMAVALVRSGLDDGEAITCAIAASRGLTVATDERKARQAMTRAGVPLASTISIVKAYVERSCLSTNAVRDLINRIGVRGRFVAPKHDPLREWWIAASAPDDRPRALGAGRIG